MRGVVNFKHPVEGSLIGDNALLHSLVLTDELAHGLILLLLLVQDMLEVATVIDNRDVAVIEVHDTTISGRTRNGASVRNMMLSLIEILLTVPDECRIGDGVDSL